MTIGLPDTFQVNKSEKYVLSIRLRSDGLSFSMHDPEENGSFFYREADFVRHSPFKEALKDFFFENELFSYSFRKIKILYEPAPYTLVPETFYCEEKAGQFLEFNFLSAPGHVTTNPVSGLGLAVVFGIEEEIYEFCSRSLLAPAFIHHITPLLIYWSKLSADDHRKLLFADLHGKQLDVAGFERGKLLFANTFSFEHPNDILYYILYVWKQLKMDQLTDSLRISGRSDLRMQLTEVLHNYIRWITPAEAPAEVYLWGEEAVKAPLDLLTLSICEL